MPKKTENRTTIDMACTICKDKNYTTSKNRRNDTARLELRKFCRRCRQHTPHREQR